MQLLTSAVLVGSAFFFRQFLNQRLNLNLPAFILFYPAVMAATLLDGLWPGLLATALASLLALVWIFPPVGSFKIDSPTDGFSLAIFSIVGVAISILAERYKLSERHLRRLEKERTLYQARATLEAALTSMPDAVFVADDSMNFVHFNRAFPAFHRFKSDEECPRDMSKFPELFEFSFPDGEIAPTDQWPMRRALRGETGINQEYTIRRKDTGETWVGSFNYGPIRDREGNVVSAVATAREITDIKRAMDAVRASEVRYRNLFKTSFDPILVVRLKDGKFIDISHAYSEIIGYTRGEVLGHTTLQLKLWADPSHRDRLVEILARRGSCRGFETRMRRKSGEVFWATIAATVTELDGEECSIEVIRDTSDVRKAEAEIESLVFVDPLTGLANRRKLTDKMRRTVNEAAILKRNSALLYIDLDGFKNLNDAFGHPLGDHLLKLVALRLAGCVRKADTVARINADEFALMIQELDSNTDHAARDAGAVAQKVLDAMEQPFSLPGRECYATCSIGISIFGAEANDVSIVLQQAEMAMFQAKGAGGNTFRYYTPDLHLQLQALVATEEELRRAIRDGQFELYFQPQVDNGRIVGAEALLRWKHPERGIISPGEFIPVAEESGLIVPIGYWVLEAACRQLTAWAARPETASMSVAVNISAVQLRKPDFVEQVLSIVKAAGADPRRLKLEITESTLLEQVEQVIARMTLLRDFGPRFSLDDFGTGYSSMAYLKRLPLGELKIDRSFTRDVLVDEGSAAIAHAIVSLSGALGLPVIAEGVESNEQRQYLAAIGCSAIQGYLISRPLPIGEFEQFLDRRWAGSPIAGGERAGNPAMV